MSNQQYEPSTDEQTVEQYYRERVSEWFSWFAFRLLVYVTITAFTMSHIFVFSKLHESGIITEGVEGLNFGFALVVIVTTGFMFKDFARGVSYATISQTGKHRGYLAVGLVVVAVVGIAMSDPGKLSGEHAEAYRSVAWAMAAVVGLEIARGGICKDDVNRLRGVLS